MFKALCAVVALVVLAGGCERGSKPNPKPRKTHVVSYGAVVVICADVATLVRAKDKVCQDLTSGFAWHYVVDRPTWPLELPAVGERLEAGRGDWAEPADAELFEALPDEGGWFSRNPPVWVTPSSTVGG